MWKSIFLFSHILNENCIHSFRMATNTPAKRSRATTEQLFRMVDYFMDNPGLAEGKLQKLWGKYEHDKKWTEMAAMLNNLGGSMKTVEQWHTVRTVYHLLSKFRKNFKTGMEGFEKPH